jgi:hypothetical protein
MEDENVKTDTIEVTEKEDTKHEPHKHAQSRVLIGVGAVLLLLFAGIAWSRWGDTIQEKCLGDGEVCEVELPAEAPFE